MALWFLITEVYTMYSLNYKYDYERIQAMCIDSIVRKDNVYLAIIRL